MKKYSPQGLWVERESADSKTAKMGVGKKFSQEVIKASFIVFPSVKQGDSFKKDQALLRIEGEDMWIWIIGPLNAKIVEYGRIKGFDDASNICKDPEGRGYLCRIEIADDAEFDALLDEEPAPDAAKQKEINQAQSGS